MKGGFGAFLENAAEVCVSGGLRHEKEMRLPAKNRNLVRRDREPLLRIWVDQDHRIGFGGKIHKASISDGGHHIFSRSAPSHATVVSSPSPTAGGHLHSTTAAGRTPSPSFFYSHRSQGILPLPLSLLSIRDVLCVRDISSSRGLGFVTDSTGDFIPSSSEFEQQHLLQIWSAQQTSIPTLLLSSGPDLASHSSTFSSTAVFKFDQQFFNRSGQLLFVAVSSLDSN
ncbi:hypothetical protein ZIOFF_056086 [Zingiber officinale]|uniref:Uncharacterized protein n=1 Tax=Zingiber officinale TaxID=94328 RepID=A0A8J5FHI2_ZINOF|nr:hypothetical protein ZIOFF_056086 [Zingiber officinale]